MAVEVLAILATFVGGAALMRLCGLRGWALVPLGFIAGTALYITVGFVQLVARFPTTPVWTMLVTGVVPVTLWGIAALRKRDVGVGWRGAIIAIGGVVVLTVVLRLTNMLAWHVDSHDYLGLGQQLAAGTYETFPREALLRARLIGIPLIHAPASLTNDYYLRSAASLMALATFAAIVWFFLRGTKHLVDRRTVVMVAILGLAFLVTSNRVIHHVFYVNGHLMTGTFVLLVAAAGWLLATRRNGVEARTLVALMVVSLPAVVVTRPEGAVLAAVALLPILVSASVTVRVRALLLVGLGLPMVVWHGYVYVLLTSQGYEYEWSTVGMLALGAAMCVAAIVLPVTPWLKDGLSPRARGYALGGVETLMWLLLLLFTVREPNLMERSVLSTAKNQVVGGWGVTVIALGAFAVLAAFMLRNHWTSYLRFPTTTFLPMVFLLAYMRDGGYRVGVTDSLNRMWIQVIPIAVLYVMAAIALDRADRVEKDETAKVDVQ